MDIIKIFEMQGIFYMFTLNLEIFVNNFKKTILSFLDF